MISVGDFERIYDPSVGEGETWYINDHTIFRDHTGTLAPDRHHPRRADGALRGGAPRPRHRADARTGRGRSSRFALTADPGLGRDAPLGAPRGPPRRHATGCTCAPAAPRRRSTASTWPPPTMRGRGRAIPPTRSSSTASRPAIRWCSASVTGGSSTTRPRQRAGRWAPRRGGRRVRRPRALVAAGTSSTPTRWRGRWPAPPSHRSWSSATAAGTCSSAPTTTRWRRRSRDTGRYDLPRLPAHPRAGERRPAARSTSPTRSATIDAHAAEVVVDERGDWWVTHCGWGQGGVSLAPLAGTMTAHGRQARRRLASTSSASYSGAARCRRRSPACGTSPGCRAPRAS